jgi:hypothetical protein
MNTLIANQALLDWLRQAKRPAEIRDESGTVVGVYSPVPAPNGGQAHRKVRTREEETALLVQLERRARNSGPEVTFRVAFERLLALTNDPNVRTLLRGKIEMFAERERGCQESMN